MPGVFRRNNINALQDLKSPQGDIAQITDRRSNNVKHFVILGSKLASRHPLDDGSLAIRRRAVGRHQPKTFAKTKGTTMVASDSITNLGVSTFSFPHVIFSLGTAPEYEPKLVVESLIWQK